MPLSKNNDFFFFEILCFYHEYNLSLVFLERHIISLLFSRSDGSEKKLHSLCVTIFLTTVTYYTQIVIMAYNNISIYILNDINNCFSFFHFQLFSLCHIQVSFVILLFLLSIFLPPPPLSLSLSLFPFPCVSPCLLPPLCFYPPSLLHHLNFLSFLPLLFLSLFPILSVYLFSHSYPSLLAIYFTLPFFALLFFPILSLLVYLFT